MSFSPCSVLLAPFFLKRNNLQYSTTRRETWDETQWFSQINLAPASLDKLPSLILKLRKQRELTFFQFVNWFFDELN